MSNETKHTPGPWKTEMGTSGDHWVLTASADGMYIAKTIANLPGVQAANARLIAAAPELLAHLQKLLKEMGMIEQSPARVPESCYQAFSAAHDFLDKKKLL